MNPFKILNIGAGASKKEIIQAVALAMREKKYSGRELARAQKMLLDPVSGAAQAFLHCIDIHPLKDRLVVKKPAGLDRPDISGLSRLSIFDGEV
jgi:hypothetical protein